MIQSAPTVEAASIGQRRDLNQGLSRRFPHQHRQVGRKVRLTGDYAQKACRIRQKEQPASTTAAPPVEPTESPVEQPVETPAETSAEPPVETPVETPAETPVETPAWTPSSTVEEQPQQTSSPGSGPSINWGSKTGLSWPNGDWADHSAPDYIGNYVGNTVNFLYDWHYKGCFKGSDLGLEYVPMMWGAKDASPDFYAAQKEWPSSTQHVLFFNEPNDPGQANISPEDSVHFWREYMSPLKKQGYKIGMAATTSAPSGLEWVLKFKEVCPDCWDECDFVPLHYYDVSVEHFQSYVTNYHDKVQKPIWVTEYACQNFNGGAQCSWDETQTFHHQMADWFNSQDYIERYSPFGAMKNMQGVNEANRLMGPDGHITDLGRFVSGSCLVFRDGSFTGLWVC